MEKPKQVILHLSDLHFGCDRSDSERAARALALEGLNAALLRVEPEWKPTIVCISGDIGFKGIAEDYRQATGWLTKLLDDLDIAPDHVLTCAGNHDIERDKATYDRPTSGKEADAMLQMPLHKKYAKPFEAYVDFVRSFGIPALNLGSGSSHLIGQRMLEGISFCSLNSSWFCRDKYDKEQLWIGRPYFDVLEQAGQVQHTTKLAAAPPTVFLLHHPKDWFHQSEIHSVDGRANTFDVIAGRCHLILTGHTHGESRRPDRNGGAAHIMTGGATYDSSTYNNAFTLIRVGSDRFTYRTFDYDPRSAIREWRQTIPASDLLFRDSIVQGAIGYASRVAPGLNDFRQAAQRFAAGISEDKARALRPQGILPRTVPSLVTLGAAKIPSQDERAEQTQRVRELRPIPLIEAVRGSRRTLLLGDLGSGKSTLAAAFVIESLVRSHESIALVIPAKLLSFNGAPGSVPWTTVKAFLHSISSFVNDHVLPQAKNFDLLTLLESDTEVMIAVDGLDEVSQLLAKEILGRLAEVIDHWSTSQVLATGRPVEMTGLDYTKWQLCSPLPVSDDDKLQLFIEEAIADGRDDESAAMVATAALHRLRSIPDLHFMADTPLFCKLLFDQLQTPEPQEVLTLGDLLYKLLSKRLAEWAVDDNKVNVSPLFDTAYPDADSRVRLLSHLAASMDRFKVVPIERARRLIDTLIPNMQGVSKPQLVDQALRSLTSAGLVSIEGGNFELALRSFDDFCRGYALADAALSEPSKLLPQDVSEWRSVSFAATMIRRFGALDELRGSLCKYIDSILDGSNGVAACSYIVSESRDHETAVFYVERLPRIGRRPLSFSFQSPAWPQTAQAMAESIRLAGAKGFDWFFHEYIDPRFPVVFTGGQLTVEVFLRWAALNIGRLSDDEKAKLDSLIMPHMAADSHEVAQVIPALAVLIPNAFDVRTRIKHCIGLLESPQFTGAAEELIKAAIGPSNLADILRQFEDRLHGGDSHPNAALLYLSLSEGKPGARIVRTLLSARRGRRADRVNQLTFQRLKELIGDDALQRLCRWYLFDGDSMLSAGAAIELFDLGERSLTLLSSPLIQALHDGGYVPRAEDVLLTLIAEDPAPSIESLVTYIANAHTGHGGHSGWWRVLLQFIRDPKLRGPEFLVDCLRGIGEFLLCRNPDIRNTFRNLVLDPQASRFRSALRGALNHEEPATRHGAAMVLITCDPSTESKALETVVNWKARHDHGAWFEWEQFCLTLRFGPAVLSHLLSKLPRLRGEARVFALAILFKNAIPLDSSQFQELIAGSLKSAYSDDILGEQLHSDRIRHALIVEVDEGNQESARKSAETLLDRYREELDDEHLVRCTVLAMDSSSWRRPEFAKELGRLKASPEYAARVVEESQLLVERGFPRPQLETIYQAEGDPSLWEGLVWDELCRASPGFRVGPHGQWILEFLLTSPANRDAIGKAAYKFLYDSRISQGFNMDEQQSWLALLAHEAGQLTQEELGEIVDRIDPNDKSAYVPLITRLGRPPKSDKPRRRRFHPSRELPEDRITPERATFQQFIEFARPADVMHSDFCTLIECSLFNPPFTADELDLLAKQSAFGTLVAGALATAYGILPKPAWMIVAISQAQPGRHQSQHCFQTILNLWRIAGFVAREDNDWRARYLAELKGGLTANGNNLSSLASALFSIEHSLSAPHLDLVLRHLAATMFDEHDLFSRLSHWLSAPESASLLEQVALSVDDVIETLDLQPWNIDEGFPRESGAYLMFPLLRWRIAGSTDTASRRVFLRGLKMALTPPRTSDHQLSGHQNRFVGIEDVAPLIATVDRSLFEETLRYGLTLDDHELRTICRLFILDIHSFASEV